jgi:hypothetical protein
LFLAAIVGVGIAATSQTARPKAVAFKAMKSAEDNRSYFVMLQENGSLWQQVRRTTPSGHDCIWEQLLDSQQGLLWKVPSTDMQLEIPEVLNEE